ncbi:50S ribosomal protein L17 [Patescibacteria group bacterium]
MRNQKKGRKLGRETGQRKALIKSLMNSFVKYGKIETTEAKAKELRPRIEKLITKAKLNNLANRRILARYFTPAITKKMMDEIGPRYKERKGGYTRITKLSPRAKDRSPMAIIEFV